MPRVSVIMPAYNHASFVRQAVESVLGQSFTDLELIVYDDGSTDGTADVVRSISDARLKLEVLSRNHGATWAVNSALERAQGDYIAIINSDDYFLPGKLDSQVRFLEETPGVAAVFGLPMFVDERGQPLPDEKNPFRNLFEKRNRSREEWLHRFFVIGNALCHPTVMVRRSCYDELGPYDARLAQLPDYDFWIRICSRYDIHILPQHLTAYRVLDGDRNASAGQPRAKVRHDWELHYVFRRYLALSDDELRRVFAAEFAELDPSDRQRPRVLLGRLALKIGPSAWASSSYLAFGLDILHHALAEDASDISHSEYLHLTGVHDVFNQTPRAERAEMERLKQKLKAMRPSISWRATWPLRYMVEKNS